MQALLGRAPARGAAFTMGTSARQCRESVPEERREVPVEIAVKQSAGAPRPLSFPQERLFLLDRITPGLPVYNVPTLVRVGTTLDEDLLCQGLNAIVARHEILRTTISLVDGVPTQEVGTPRDVELASWDLRSLPADEREDRAEELL